MIISKHLFQIRILINFEILKRIVIFLPSPKAKLKIIRFGRQAIWLKVLLLHSCHDHQCHFLFNPQKSSSLNFRKPLYNHPKSDQVPLKCNSKPRNTFTWMENGISEVQHTRHWGARFSVIPPWKYLFWRWAHSMAKQSHNISRAPFHTHHMQVAFFMMLLFVVYKFFCVCVPLELDGQVRIPDRLGNCPSCSRVRKKKFTNQS